VPKLRTTNNPEENISSEEILDALLIESAVAGSLPTDERKLLRFLKLEQMSFDFAREVDFLDDSIRPPGELRAALHLGERVIATQVGLGDKRKRFSIFHEIAHCVLPEHNSRLFLDTDQTLSWWTRMRFEREANQFAADLLFQGKLFTEQAMGRDTSIQTVIGLAPKYGASYEAALRRYAEKHVQPCALIVYDKIEKNEESFVQDDEFRIQYTVASGPFRKLYFSGVQMAVEKCKAVDICGPNDAWRIGRIIEKDLTIEDRGRAKWRFESEIFSNGYKIFQFLRQPSTRATRDLTRQ